MCAAQTTVEAVTGIAENHFSDLFGLASAEHVVRVPLSGVVGRPRLTTIVTISAAFHVVKIYAAGAEGNLLSLLFRFASEHSFS